MIRFDRKSREIALAVRDLIYLDAQPPIREEPSSGLRAQAGVRAHAEHRIEAETAGRRESYEAEVPIEHRTERRGYRIAIQGRIDGLYREEGGWILEEVKSVVLDLGRFPDGEIARAVLEGGAFADYRLQLELYIFFFAEGLSRRREASAAEPVKGRLVLRSIAGGPEHLPGGPGTAEVEISPDLEAVRGWVDRRLDLAIDRVEALEASRASRRDAASRLIFPFQRLRPHQGELQEEVQKALERGEHLLISAPTGLGKTAAVLTASLRHALENGLSIFYATSKTTQQRIVAETLELIAAAYRNAAGVPRCPGAPPFHAVILRAKEKICPRLAEGGSIWCHEDYCRFAKGYSAKVEASGALAKLLSGPVAEPEAAVSLGLDAEACPFALILDGALEADVIVGDYNYVFDPESYLRPFFRERRNRDAILIIDEAHNLYARGRDSHSPEIPRASAAALERWARDLSGGPVPIRGTAGSPGDVYRDLSAWCRKLEGLLAALSARGRDELGDPPIYPLELDPGTIRALSEELDALRTRKLLASGSPGRAAGPAARTEGSGLDPLDDFAARWESFTSALEALEGATHLILYDKTGRGREGDPAGGRAGHLLRILALDPSIPLGRRIDGFRSAIALSATLEPLEFYRDVLGFPPARTRLLRFPSPFPEKNRKILVWDRISTYFRSRSRDAPRIAGLIEEIAAVEPGNYLVCFSSYRFLQEVLAHVSPEGRARALVQSPGMTEGERDQVLSLLREPGSARTVFAVQGGIFTEGVDYPGRMLIGAVIVGPGLPAVTFDEERVREHFEDRYQQGFEYAYLYPGMNRVIQCAGRVIRSETDVGAIVLLGERFSQSRYARLFPDHWYRSTPRELVSKDPIADLREFWKEVGR